MHHRDRRTGRDLRDATDIAGGNHVGRDLLDIRDFVFVQPIRQLGL